MKYNSKHFFKQTTSNELNGFNRNIFYCLIVSIVLMTATQSGFAQGATQLDTLALLEDKRERLDYILKIEETQSIPTQDSLLEVALELAKELKDDRQEVEVWMAWCHVDWMKRDIEASFEKMKKGYNVAEKINDPAVTASVLNNMGNYYQRKNQLTKADSIFEVCIEYWDEVGDKSSLSKGYKNRATVYRKMQNFPLADSLAAVAKAVADEVGDRNLQASAMTTQFINQAYSGRKKEAQATARALLDTLLPVAHDYSIFYANSVLNYAQVSGELGQLQEAMVQLLKADSVFSHYNLDKKRKDVLPAIAEVYGKLGDREQAIMYYKRSLDIGRGENNKAENSNIYNEIARQYIHLGDTSYWEVARAYSDSAYQIALTAGFKVEEASHHINIADINLLVGASDEALTAIDKAIALVEEVSSPVLLNTCLFQKADILASIGNMYAANNVLQDVTLSYLSTARDTADYYYLKGKIASEMQDYKIAASFLKKAYILNDSLSIVSQAAAIKEIGDRYQTEKQVALNEKLQAEQQVKQLTIDRQRNYLLYGGLSLSLVSLLTFLLYRQGRRKERLNTELRNKRNQILLLNQELNHRVKNNLAFMTSLLEMQGRRSKNEEIKEALQESEGRLKALSLVHANLFKNESDTKINLRDYISEILGHLQEVFDLGSKKLTIEPHLVHKVVDAEDAMRIGLIVNELVTNSVKHAFVEVHNPTIKIETTMENGKLVLRYKDNGPGIKEKDLDMDPTKQGLGVKLIKLMEKQLADIISLQVG